MAYNLFATDKQKNYPGTQTTQPVPQPDFQSDKAANYPSAMGAETTVDAPQLMPQTAAQGAGVAGGQPANVQQPVARQTAAQKTIPSIDANDPASGMDAISQMYTSPEQEEKMRRASLNNQRIMAVADALRHIGNIYHTTKYAPAQQFNSPVQEEQARYERGRAVRDAANMKYYTYQQAKAAQDAKQRQWEADYGLRMADAARKAGYTEAQIKNMQDRLAQQKAYQEGTLALRRELGEAQQKERERHNKVAESQGAARINIARQNAKNTQAYRNWKMSGGGGSGSNSIEIRGKNGFYRKNGLSSDGVDTFYDQAFEQLSKMNGANGQPIIDMQKVQGSVFPGMFGGNKITKQAKRDAVRNAIYNHPEAGDFIRDIYEFNLDERTPSSGTPYSNAQPASSGGYVAPGNTWSQGGSANSRWDSDLVGEDNDDDDDDNWDEYLAN